MRIETHSDVDPWTALRRCLDRCAEDDRTVDLWLRDDDAVVPTDKLQRLLDLNAANDVPVLLAIIPALSDEALAHALGSYPLAVPCQHGFRHTNHAPAAERSQELGPHRPLPEINRELAAGRDRLRALYAPKLCNVLVPPWNRIDDGLIDALPALGFDAVSCFGFSEPRSRAAIEVINTHVDIIEWGDRRGHDHGILVERLTRSIDRRHGPVGILTHHLVHDEQAWSFLTTLFEVTVRHPAARWRSFDECRAGRQQACLGR